MGAVVHAQCFCGAVRLKAELPTLEVAHCHCDNCRRAHAAGALTYARFAEDTFGVVVGEELLTRFETPETGTIRAFCSVCGATLFAHNTSRWPGVVDVSLANILDPIDRLPDSHFFADRSPSWFPITDGLPRFGGATGEEPLEP